jgi:hypothetical protein
VEGIELKERAHAFKARVQALQPKIAQALAEGSTPSALARELEELEEEERSLLVEALPYARERLIKTRPMGGRRQVLCSDVSKISESGLPDSVIALVEEHLGEDAELEMPELPAKVEETDEGQKIQGVVLKGSLWCTTTDGVTAFAFTDEGAAYLLERNLTWQMAPVPLVEDAFPTRLCQESHSSVLFVDVDGALERLSYSRLETESQLLREPLYA